MPPEHLPQRTHAAYTAVKRQIIELALPPGATFSEGELAAELGFSKTPVREALARLRHDRLVEAVARSGYRVAPVTVKGARDLFFVRGILEPEAAALAAERGADAETLEELERLCHVTYERGNKRSTARYLEANTRFHVLLANAGGNDPLAMVLHQVLEQLERLFHVGLAIDGASEDLVHEHQELLDAVKRGDPAEARRAALRQAEASERMVMYVLLSSASVLSANLGADPEF